MDLPESLGRGPADDRSHFLPNGSLGQKSCRGWSSKHLGAGPYLGKQAGFGVLENVRMFGKVQQGDRERAFPG